MSYRKLVIDGQEWRFKVGESFVNIKDPEGKGYTVHIAIVTGVSVEEFNDGVPVSVTPGKIRRWIEANT